MRSRHRASLLGALIASGLALLSAAAATGQRDVPVTRDRIDVRLVEVDVVALDRRGRPILDLDRGDFEISVDGEKVAISTFSRPEVPAARDRRSSAARSRTSSPSPPGPEGDASSSPPPASPPPSTIVLVDERRLEPGPRNRSLGQLADWVSESDTDSRWRLIRIDTRVRTEEASLDGWLDSASMQESVESLRRADSGNVMRSQERERLIDQLEELGMCSGQALAMVEQAWSAEVGEVAGVLDSLHDLAVLLGEAPGRKTLVYVGEGLPLRPLEDIRQTIAVQCPDRRDLALRAARGLDRRLVALASAANASRVTFHMLEASGLRTLTRSSIQVNPLRPASGNAPATSRDNTPGADFSVGELQGRGGGDLGFRSVEAETARHLMLQDSLLSLARATGGLAALNTNRLGPAFEDVDRYRSSGYVLGFAYEGPADGSTHRVDVRASTDRAELHYRRSFGVLTPEVRMETRLRAAADGLQADNPLKATAALKRLGDAGDGTGRYELRIRLPASRVVRETRDDGHTQAILDLHLLARSVGGEPVTARQRQTVELSPDQAEATALVVALPLVLRDEDGRTLAIAVTDTLSGITSVLGVHTAD